MSRKRSKKKSIPTKYTLLIMTIICVVTIFLSLTINLSGGPLKTVAGYLFIPMQSGLNRAGTWLSDQTNQFTTLSEVLKENSRLQSQVDELTTTLTNLKLDQYELETLQELYALDKKHMAYKKIAASVVAKDSGNWFSTFTVDKGSKDGVQKGMNVIAGSGLVGIVTDVGDNFSTIRSIIDDTSNVSAMVESTGDNFNVNGSLEAMNRSDVIEFSELKDSEDKVHISDPVVTSYVSDQYLQGFLIGYISSIEENANNLTKSGTITPVVDFEHLREVLIILDMKEITGVSQDKPEEASETQTASETESESRTQAGQE